jgi:hypothetical protein
MDSKLKGVAKMPKSWFMELIEQHDPEFAGVFAANRELAMREGAIPAK